MMTAAGPGISVLLVDDHSVVRFGYRSLLGNDPRIEVRGEADTGEKACRLYTELAPDVVVMDLSLPGIGGLEAIRRIRARDPEARILVFSMHAELAFVDQALNAGVMGYITKDSAPDTLIDAIKQVAARNTYIDEDIARRMVFQKARGNDSPFSSLSTREFEIFCLLAEGRSNSDIGRCMSLSEKTIANHGTRIKNKLEVSTLSEMTRLAIRYKLIQA